MISRYLLIALAFGAGVYRAMQGAWLTSAGLLALGGGLVILRVSQRQPALKRVAYLCFAVTAATLVTVLMQRRP